MKSPKLGIGQAPSPTWLSVPCHISERGFPRLLCYQPNLPLPAQGMLGTGQATWLLKVAIEELRET